MRPGLKFNTGFTPTSISGCQLWLDGSDSSRLTLSGSNVTAWNDKSGNGRNTTTTGTVSYANSGISITTSSSYLTGSFGTPDYTGSTVTCFIVGSMSSSSGSVARFLSLGKVGTQDWDNLASITLGRGGGLLIRPYRTVPTQSPPSIPAYDTRFLATWGQTSSSLFNSINGGALSTASLSGAFAINAYRIGNDLLPDDVNEQFNGVINEIVVYFSELTIAQREQVEGYLAQKWGLKSNLPGNHPGITTTIYPSRRQVIIAPVPYYTQFSPTSIAGSVIWLDAADTTKYTLSGSNVTQIVDKSSNAYTFTGSAGSYPTQTTTLNGLPVISSATGQYLRTTNFNQNFLTATCFFIMRPTENLSTLPQMFPNYTVIRGSVGGMIETGLVYYQGGNYPYLYQSGQGLLSGNELGFSPLNKNLLITGIVTGTGATNEFYTNGSLNIRGGENGTFNQLSSQILNCIGHPQYSHGYDFAEVILYGSVLTATQRQQVESYLAQKWGSTTSLPGSHLNTTQPAGTPNFTQTVFKQIKRTIGVNNPTAPPVVSVRLINLNSASGGTTSGSFTVNSSVGGGTGTFTNSDVFISDATWGMAQCFNGARSDYDLYMTQNPNFMEIVFPRALTVTKIFLVPRNQGDAFPSSLILKADGTSVGTYTPTTVSQLLGMGISYTGTGFYIQPSISRTTWRFDFSSTPVSFGEIEFWGYST